jgi:hypothetical protein
MFTLTYTPFHGDGGHGHASISQRLRTIVDIVADGVSGLMTWPHGPGLPPF